jgi:hypothetical protein
MQTMNMQKPNAPPRYSPQNTRTRDERKFCDGRESPHRSIAGITVRKANRLQSNSDIEQIGASTVGKKSGCLQINRKPSKLCPYTPKQLTFLPDSPVIINLFRI